MFFDPVADSEQTQTEVFLGGPRLYVLNATVGQGIAPTSTASTLSDGPFHDWTDGFIALNAAAGFYGRGIFMITHPTTGGVNVFTYEQKIGNSLVGLRRIAGSDVGFPDNTLVSQWRDITEYVGEVKYAASLAGAEGVWSVDLIGDSWDSLIQFPDATIMIRNRHRNSTYHDMSDPDDWGPWQLAFWGYLGPVKVRGTGKGEGADITDWTVTAYGESYYLRQLANIPGVYGSPELTGTDTASSELKDPSQAPSEGNGYAPLTVASLTDSNRNTSWVSAGVPTTETELVARPNGEVQASPPNPSWATGFGIKIQQVYPTAYANLDRSIDMGAWVELYNNVTEESSDPYSTAGQPIDQLTWGMIDLSGLAFEFDSGAKVFFGGGGGLAPGTMLGPGQSAIFCYDRETFLRTWRVPEGTAVYEWRRFDGWVPGLPVTERQRGAGSYGTMKRRGSWIALRGMPRIDGGDFCEFWHDFVAWGNVTPPSTFRMLWNETIYNQNSTGYPMSQVWGNRSAMNAPAITVPGDTVAPNGLNEGESIRRIVMGGGAAYDLVGVSSLHDSATKNDWEVMVTPIIGNQAPATSVEWVERDLGEFPAATVVSDDTEIDGTITVGAGEALLYEEACILGETVQASGGGVRFRYDYRDASTFYGVVKVQGAGIDCTGEELKMRINVAPDGRPPQWALANLYCVPTIELMRWYSPPACTVVRDRAGVPGENYIEVLPGQARRFPWSGTLAGVSGTTLRSWTVSYTHRDDSNFYGCSGASVAARPGGQYRIAAQDSYPSRMKVLITKQDTTIDPLVNFGNNPHWQLVAPAVQGGVNNRMFTGTVSLGGNSMRARRIRVVVEQMSDAGRAVLSEYKTYGTPRRIIPDALMAGRSRSGQYTHANLIEDILIAAGVEPYRIVASGGRPIRSEQITEGNVWETCLAAAEKGGLIIIDGPYGQITIMDDPRLASKAVTRQPTITLDETTIGADVDITPLPRHQVSQIELTGYNQNTNEVWSIRHPATPGPYGNIRRFGSRPALDYGDLQRQARLLWATMNGGYQATVSISQQDNIQLGEVVPFDAVIDKAGIKYGNDLLMITGVRRTANWQGQTGTLIGRDYRGS